MHNVDIFEIAEKVLPCCVLKGDVLYKYINNQWVGKQSVQCVRPDKTTHHKWLEGVDSKDIDLRYYNIKGERL